MANETFPIGGGETGARVRAHGWAGTPLGPLADWPTALRMALSFILSSPEAAYLVWGRELLFFHNDACRPILGSRLDRALGARFPELWADAWELVGPMLAQAQHGEPSRFDDLPVILERRGVAEETWWTFSFTPFRDEAGAVAGVICITRETTRKVLAERTRLNEVERLRELFEQSPSFVAGVYGPDHRFFLANPAYRRLIGGRDVIGSSIREALPELAGQGMFEELDRVLESGRAVSARGREVAVPRTPAAATELRRLDFVYQPIRAADGVITGVFVEGVDVTEAHAVSLSLRESEDRSRQILDSAIDYAIFATDMDGAVTRWNTGAESIFGWTEAEMTGRPVHRLFTPQDVAADRISIEMRQALEEGRRTDERWHLRKSGERFWASGEMTLLRGADATPTGFVKVLRDRTAEHQGAEALAATEARLRRAQEAGGVGVFSVEFADDRLYGSREFCRIFGLPDCDGVPASDVEALVVNEDAGQASSTLTRARGTVASDVEYRIRRKDDGAERVISRRGELERDDAGAPVRLVGVVQDVTEQRAAQRAVERSEAQFRAFAQAVPNHVWTAEPDGRLDWANERAYAYSGQEAAALRRDGWAAWLHPDDAARAVEHWSTSLRTGADYETEFRIRRADGAFRWHLVRATPLRDGDGAVAKWLGTNTDIEDQKAISQALQALNDELESRVEARTRERDRAWRNSQDLIVVLDARGAFVQVSPAATKILGWTPEEMVGSTMFDFVHPEDREPPDAAPGRAIHDPSPVFENRYRHKDGSYRWLSWVSGAEGELITATARDVTQAKAQAAELAQAQGALRQAQKMEAVGQLTGGIAHDFNNLLTGITGSLELLEARIAQGRYEAVPRYLAVAQGAAQRAASLTQRLLAFSRRQTLDPKPTDVNRLINGMEDLVRRSVGPLVQVEIVGAGGLWPTLIDPPQLENALLNLCINARDAMPRGGRITIETANKWLDERAGVERELPPGQYLSLCVTDTGTGMTPEVVARAFDPFFTTKPLGQGTGLGLSMTYGFVRQSGGQVRIYSEEGLGATICLYLPRHYGDAAPAEAVARGADTPAARMGETVLIVDDEPTVRMLVAEVLGEAGYTSIEAVDGASGLKVLESGTRVDLLVTDVGLPGGLNGRQVADAGRVLRPGLKVLFITGYAENAAVGNGHLDPGMELLTKPFAMTALAAKIREMIQG